METGMVLLLRMTMSNYLTERQALAKISASSQDDWFKIKNAASDVAEVMIYSEIGYLGRTADDFQNELASITAPTINVRINSVGGSIFDGIAIYNAIRSHPSQVTTQVDSLAASIASVIAQAGDRRVMTQHSQMMIHEAHGIAIGGAEDMRDYAAILERQSDMIAAIYAERAADGRSKARFRNMMAEETWFSDQEAVEAGLADEVVTPSKNTNKTSGVESDDVNNEQAGAVEAKVDFSDLFSDNYEEIFS